MLRKNILISLMVVALTGCSGSSNLFGPANDQVSNEPVPSTSYVGTLSPDMSTVNKLDPSVAQPQPINPPIDVQDQAATNNVTTAPQPVSHRGLRKAVKLNAPLPNAHGTYNPNPAAAPAAAPATMMPATPAH